MKDPAVALPHRHPFVLLDRVLMLEPGRWAVALRNLTRDDPLADGDGRLPPVLLAEAMAQAAGLAVAAARVHAAPGLLAQIDRFRCRAVAGGGDRLWVTVRVLRRFGRTVKVRASVRVDGRRCAAGELVLYFPAATEPAP